MITSEQLRNLKAAIKSEMARRGGYGSLSSDSGYGYAKDGVAVDYSGPNFDFAAPPPARFCCRI